MSLTVAFDTATPDTVVAVCEDGRALAERNAGPEEGGRPRHGSELLRFVEEAVEEAGGWEAVGSVAVGIGPGSFTGIRIGVATARALAQARGLPLAGVPSTASLAAGIPEPEEEGRGRARIAVIDARRGEAFAAVLAPGERLAAPAEVLEPAALAGLAWGLRDGGAPIAAGDGAIRFRSDLEAAGAEVLDDGDPAHRLSARLVASLAPDFGPGAADDVKPLYLRRPDAERWRERNRGER